MIENPGDGPWLPTAQEIDEIKDDLSNALSDLTLALSECEECGSKATTLHGMDQTPLCDNHERQAVAREEATIKYMEEKREMRTDIPNEYVVKQVILIRRDLGMRRGKEIAQGAHASIAFLTNALHDAQQGYGKKTRAGSAPVDLSDAAWQWINGRFTKVVLQVFSEEELLSYYDKARAAGLTAHVIQDSGQTEFKGQPTYTTCAIGPNRAEDIDKVTGDLKLY